MIEFTTIVDRISNLRTFIIVVPVEAVEQFDQSTDTRFWCTIEGSLRYQCGLMNYKGGQRYFAITSDKLKALDLEVGCSVHVTLEKDESEYGMPFPVELEVLLDQDQEGKRRFDGLTIGKRRNIIYFINQAKREQTRIDRAILLIGHLKQIPEGKEDMRQIMKGPGA